MMLAVLATFVNLFVPLFSLLLFTRVVLSWIMPHLGQNLFGRVVFNLTEPILAPVRRLLPRSGFIDLSPLVVFLALQLIMIMVNRLAGGG